MPTESIGQGSTIDPSNPPRISANLFIPGTEFEIHEEAFNTKAWARILQAGDTLKKNDTSRESFVDDPIAFLKSNAISDFALLRRIGSDEKISLYEVFERIDSRDTLTSLITIADQRELPEVFPVFIAVFIFVAAVVAVKTVVNVNTYANANVLANANVNANANVSVNTFGIGLASVGGLGPLVLPTLLPADYATSPVAAALETQGLNIHRQQSLLKYTVTTVDYVTQTERLEGEGVRVTAERMYKGVPFKVVAIVTEQAIKIETVVQMTCTPASTGAGYDRRRGMANSRENTSPSSTT